MRRRPLEYGKYLARPQLLVAVLVPVHPQVQEATARGRRASSRPRPRPRCMHDGCIGRLRQLHGGCTGDCPRPGFGLGNLASGVAPEGRFGRVYCAEDVELLKMKLVGDSFKCWFSKVGEASQPRLGAPNRPCTLLNFSAAACQTAAHVHCLKIGKKNKKTRLRIELSSRLPGIGSRPSLDGFCGRRVSGL